MYSTSVDYFKSCLMVGMSYNYRTYWLNWIFFFDYLNDLKKEVDANEIDRIKYEILQFSGSLRNGSNRTETDYQHIEAIFTKYKNKGGNSYIKHEMEYIRECHDKGMIL